MKKLKQLNPNVFIILGLTVQGSLAVSTVGSLGYFFYVFLTNETLRQIVIIWQLINPVAIAMLSLLIPKPGIRVGAAACAVMNIVFVFAPDNGAVLLLFTVFMLYLFYAFAFAYKRGDLAISAGINTLMILPLVITGLFFPEFMFVFFAPVSWIAFTVFYISLLVSRVFEGGAEA
ncbi:MAG: hypothetical protein LBC82_01615 [Oscillospiraceae bacterium]|jgi:hypothetical protein|nr:hypothetical protein [Oscillospiraceae bacterium]